MEIRRTNNFDLIRLLAASQVVLMGLLTCGFLLVHILRPLRAWNAAATWGYTTKRSLLASISMIGWPVAVLVTFGEIF